MLHGLTCAMLPAAFRFAVAWFTMLAGAAADAGGDAVDFARDVRPILARRCFACHGPDAESREAGLRLDRIGAVVGHDAPAVIVPGRPGDGGLIERITSSDPDLRMPPPASGEPLTPRELDLVRRWIAAGAVVNEHWSFRPVVRPPPPSVRDDAWPRGPIDAFVLDRLRREGLAPSPEADAATLCRRLHLDLVGLPSDPEEAAAFAAAYPADPSAYDALVDRLLASPHFGERQARHWLDIAHYADSDGYLGDALRPHAWLYRDWVVDAINRDLPFDRFTIAQLAGDLLPDATLVERTATGFLRNTLRNTEAGVDLEEYRLKEIVDRAGTVGIGWLGLSVACAECHAHKYDPISQEEFYGVFAFFNDADDVDVPAPQPGEDEAHREALAGWQARESELVAALAAAAAPDDGIEPLRAALATTAKRRSAAQRAVVDAFRRQADEATRPVADAYEKHVATKPKAPATKAMTVARRQETRPTFVHLRGDYRRRGPRVTPGTPAVLPPLESRGAEPDRLDLARWLVDPQHPLTPRVAVNHLWKHLFGEGIVRTVDDFGATGEPPSHPALLDWLAAEFVARGWSRKQLIREIVMSATYRQASRLRPELAAHDPRNRLLARQGRFRVEAEIVRDTALAAAGLLERRFGGPGIRPPQPAYVASISRNADWPVSTGADRHRRGLYVLLRRATPYPMLQTFDAPDSTVACTRRERTNSPLQALTLLNDPVFVECAQALGARLADGSGGSDEERIAAGFGRCLGRRPSTAETARIATLLAEERRRMIAAEADARRLIGDRTHAGVDPAEQAAWVVVARVLLNLDEFVTRE